jgi:membrane-bound serine protease (ClpP class)
VLWPTVAVVGAGSLLAGRLAWRARRTKPVSGAQLLVDREAVVRSAEGATGRVLFEGAWWTVRSRGEPLHEGQKVRIVALEDLTLIVEPAQPFQEKT